MTPLYRENVCLFIINQDNKLFIGERLKEPGIWQLPQGGVEKEFTLEENAIREASEELGASAALFEVLKKFDATHKYDYSVVPNYAQGKFRGQKQTFWLVQFWGDDKDIKLDRFHPEFLSYRWINSNELLTTVEAKRAPGYTAPLKEFETWLKAAA
jgi:putative (di)nucleoside polyphosphate hydrolase